MTALGCFQVFTVMGEAVEQAVVLQRVGCKAQGVPLLVTEAVVKQVLFSDIVLGLLSSWFLALLGIVTWLYT